MLVNGSAEFRASGLNPLWLTDITEHPTGEGKLYLSAIKDACSNRIVGYSMDARMTAQLAVDALTNAAALRRHRPVCTVVHSDRGSSARTPSSARCRERVRTWVFSMKQHHQDLNDH